MERVAAVILLRSDGAALLQHRDVKPGLRHSGSWVPPGGHAEPGESMFDCAQREFLEETEYRLQAMHGLLETRDETPGFATHLLTIFWAFYDGVQPLVCHEGQALEFIVRADADVLDIPAPLLAAWDLALQRAATPLPVVSGPKLQEK